MNKNPKNKEGVVLILVIFVVVVLAILGGALVTRSVSERNLAQRYDWSARAFWLAEAGISRALKEVKDNFTTSDLGWSQNLGPGSGSYDVVLGPIYPVQMRNATSTGIFDTIQRIIRVVLAIPQGFWDNAIYSAENITNSGNSGSITGNVSYNGSFTSSPAAWAAGITSSPTAKNLLPDLDFVTLKAMSIVQGLFCNAACVAAGGPGGTYPTSFWNNPPTNTTPNIVYIEGSDMDFNHPPGPGITAYGGFYIVVDGDVEFHGKVQVDGVVYTPGEVTFDGGGNILNINGGIFSGEDTTINGGPDLSYNQTYMHTLKDMDVGNEPPEVIYWEDLQNPYPLN